MLVRHRLCRLWNRKQEQRERGQRRASERHSTEESGAHGPLQMRRIYRQVTDAGAWSTYVIFKGPAIS